MAATHKPSSVRKKKSAHKIRGSNQQTFQGLINLYTTERPLTAKGTVKMPLFQEKEKHCSTQPTNLLGSKCEFSGVLFGASFFLFDRMYLYR